MAKLSDYERSDLPERTKVALRLADRLAGERPIVDPELHAALRQHFSGDELIDLGMTLTFFSGWQRFVEAFGIVPDSWRDGTSPTWGTPGVPQAP